MKILQRYITFEFIKILLLTTASLLLLLFIVEIVEKVDDLMEHGVPFMTGLYYFLYKLPALLAQISPMAVLLATLLSINVLNRHNEITAIKAGGIGIGRFIAPLLICGVVISGAVILLNESITPHTERNIRTIEARYLNGDGTHFGKNGLWLKTPSAVINIRSLDITDLEDAELNGIRIYHTDDDFQLVKETMATSARWVDNRWQAEGVTIRESLANGAIKTTHPKDYTLEELKSPEELTGGTPGFESMNFTELRGYIKKLEADGFDTARHRTELYSKLSFPLVNLIMILVAVPFALKSGRNTSISGGVAMSVVIGFSYWIIFAITKSIGASGAVAPIVGAVFPNVLFIAIGVLMFSYVRE